MLSHYQTDYGHTFYYVRVQAKVTSEEGSLDVQDVIPEVIKRAYLQEGGSLRCGLPNIKPRYLQIRMRDGSTYKIDIPFNAEDFRYPQLLQEIRESPDVAKADIFGEVIEGYVLKRTI